LGGGEVGFSGDAFPHLGAFPTRGCFRARQSEGALALCTRLVIQADTFQGGLVGRARAVEQVFREAALLLAAVSVDGVLRDEVPGRDRMASGGDDDGERGGDDDGYDQHEEIYPDAVEVAAYAIGGYVGAPPGVPSGG